MDHGIIYYLNQSSNIFKRLLILTKFLHGIVKDCQKRVSKLQLGQAIVCPKTFIYCYKSEAKSKRNCLTQDNGYFTRRNVINLFIVYELDTWSRDLSMDFILGDCLFRAVKLVKNPDQEKMGIVVILLDLMHVHNFHCQIVTGVKMLLFLELTEVLG